jgi:hypothetical protein
MLKYDENLDGFVGDDEDQDVVHIDDLFTDEDEVEADPDTLEPDDDEDE